MPTDLTHWRLKDFDPGQGLSEGAAQGEGGGWLNTPAPGDTYLALIAAGRLSHPYKARNEADAAWVRDREWWWTTTFTAEPAARGEDLQLIFEGLDTFAAIYLDGEPIGQADNMFRRYAFDIAEKSADGGKHILAVCFSPTHLSVPEPNLPIWPAFIDRSTRSRRPLMRKAQFGWGWDWGPDLPTVGVWRPARLERHAAPSIADVHAVTAALSADRADLRVAVILDRARPGLRIQASLAGPDGRPVTAAVAQGEGAIALAVPNPHLWWTAGLGAQPLYTLTVRLFEGASLLDEQTRRVGIRTLALDTSDDPDEPGTSFFRFVLNGVPIFAKGVNWVPADSFVAVPDAARYRDLITRAAQANMNMIRVWGGGIYEPDLFYDLCDEQGLLVWQDFMFACAHYPEDDPAFIESVRQEVTEQVRRLRGHACLALWCGNNENEALHDFNARMSGDAGPLHGRLFYDRLIPEVLGALDPATPYRVGSPWGGPSPNSMKAGDVHNWTVWHGVPLVPDEDIDGPSDRSPEGVAFTRYAEDRARFISEFGIQAAPDMATLVRWMAPEDLVLGSDGFLGRVKDVPDKANAMMIPETGVPTTLEDYVDFSQWTQAEGLKFGIEHYRRRMPHCSGALIWQYNDCWPCISWSLIDYDGVAKPAHYAVTRAFAPVMASFRIENGAAELWIVNDTLAPVTGTADLRWTPVTCGPATAETLAFEVPAKTSARVWRGRGPSPEEALSVASPEGLFPPNRSLGSPIARLPLTRDARPQVTFEAIAPGQLRARLTATAYLTFVHLASDRPDLRFTDNHFDLSPGEERFITVTGPTDLTPSDLHAACWNDR